MSNRQLPAVLLALLALAGSSAISACGGENDESGNGTEQSARGESPRENSNGGGGEEISANDAAEVLGAQRTINAVCDRPDETIGSDAAQASAADVPAAVDTVIRIYRDNGPDGVFEVGGSDRASRMRVVATDLASQLQQCGQGAQASRLQQVVAQGGGEG